MERLSKNKYYEKIAESVFQRSTCLRRHYGAIIVKNDEIIATGYNGAPRGMCSCLEKNSCWREDNKIPQGSDYNKCFSVHAEENAMLSASRRDMLESTMYIVGENLDHSLCSAMPCPMCLRKILNSGIGVVIYRTKDGNLILIHPQIDWSKEEYLIRYKG